MSFSKLLFYSQWVCLGLMFVFVLAYRFRWMPFKPAFAGFALVTLIISIGALLALIMLLLSFGPVNKDTRLLLCVALIVGIVPLVIMSITVGKGFKVPRIHDISTNIESNIAFLNAQDRRAAGDNSIALPSDETIALQKSFYADIQPLRIAMGPKDAFDQSVEIASDLGWQVVFKDETRLQFEAIDKSAIFGFIDDIAVRISADEIGSIIDVRSVSRVGKSDLGANASRIRRFTAAFEDESKRAEQE